MRVERVLDSATRVKLLRTRFQPSLPTLPMGALQAETGATTGAVHEALAAAGVLATATRGRVTFYAPNPSRSLSDLFSAAARPGGRAPGNDWRAPSRRPGVRRDGGEGERMARALGPPVEAPRLHPRRPAHPAPGLAGRAAGARLRGPQAVDDARDVGCATSYAGFLAHARASVGTVEPRILLVRKRARPERSHGPRVFIHGSASAPSMSPPLGRLTYLYVGTSDFEADLRYYRDTLGAEVVWNFAAFGARVAAFRVASEGPLLLIADHRPAPSCMPVFAVDDLDATEETLRARGWTPDGARFGIPDGPCLLFHDASGNALAVYGDERPGALEASYVDPENERAVR